MTIGMSWMTTFPIQENFRRLQSQIDEAQGFLHGLLDENVPNIDEVALFWPGDRDDTDNLESLFEFIRESVSEDGVEYFNSASDRVKTSPINSYYHVMYDFLRVTDLPRLELMRLCGGFSPLHNQFRRPGSIVHLSFKLSTEDEYDAFLDKMHECRQYDAALAMECTGDYGRFSYWSVNGLSVYLKPRVNLRDGKSSSVGMEGVISV